MPRTFLFRHPDTALSSAARKIPNTDPVWLLPRVLSALICAGTLIFGLSFRVLGATMDSQSANPPTPPKTYFPDVPRAINDDGVVIGDYSVFYKDGPVGLVGPIAGGAGTVLVALNNRGQVLLAQFVPGLRYFVCNPVPRQCTPIGLFGQVNQGGAVRNIYLAYLTGLDDAGRVFGVFDGGHGACAVAGLPTLGTPGDVGPPPTAPASYSLIGCPGGEGFVIRAMNAKGQITGSAYGRAFLWTQGKLTILNFPGLEFTEGDAINEAGEVAGLFTARNVTSDDGAVSNTPAPGWSQSQKSFVYDGSQFRLMLMPRTDWDFLTGINNRGQVVGFYDAGGYNPWGGAVDISGDSHCGFVLDIEKFPIAHVATPTSGGSTKDAPK